MNVMLHSKEIPRNTEYTIKFMDNDSGADDDTSGADKMAKESDLVTNLDKEHGKINEDDRMGVYYLGYWVDKYTDIHKQIYKK